MSEYRDECSDEVMAEAARAIWQQHEECEHLEWVSTDNLRPAKERARDLVLLGVRLGLEAAKEEARQLRQASHVTEMQRMAILSLEERIGDIDPAAVLRKERS